MENLIESVSQLQEVISLAKIQVPIELPRLIVVGSQSSGKSSVLESIVGIDFLPRGTGIVTRCPLVLRLIKSYEDQDFATFQHIGNDCRFTDFPDVRQEIERINAEIATTMGVSTKEIFLNIYSRKVVDLTLIDLPGIIKNPLKNQSSDLDKQINKMIYDYAKQSNSIILAISPANNDLANSDALKVARNVDPEGNRTLGIITKIDLMDRGTNALEMLEGRLYKLKLGYIGVVCRAQEDIVNKVPLEVHLEKEKNFFQSHPVYKSLSSQLGFSYLTQRLSQIFKKHLLVTIPKIKLEIENLLHSTNKELNEFGNSLESQPEKNEMIFKVITGFSKCFEDFIEGKDLENCFREFAGGSMILYIFKSFYHEEIFKVETIEQVPDIEIRVAMLNATGIKGVLFIPETAFENLVVDIVKRYEKPSLECLYKVRGELYRIISAIKIPEFKRFPKLHENFVRIAVSVVDGLIPGAEKNISQIIECETNYLNISHPDFIKTKEATEMAKIQIVEGAKKPKSQPAKKPSETSWVPWLRGEPDPNFEEIGPKDRIENNLEGEMSPEELEQILSVKILIENYLCIVKKIVGDIVPKSIMRNLVIKSRQNMQNVLISSLYGNQELLETLFEENLAVAERRNYLKDLKNSLLSALQALATVNM